MGGAARKTSTPSLPKAIRESISEFGYEWIIYDVWIRSKGRAGLDEIKNSWSLEDLLMARHALDVYQSVKAFYSKEAEREAKSKMPKKR